MDKVSGRLTVFFEEPFWIGVFERISEGKLSVCKVTFGAEPKNYEVYLIRGFTNMELRKTLSNGFPDMLQKRGRMSRELSKLRVHGLIRKIPHSRRYLVSDKGRRIMGALIENKRKIYPELAAF